MLKTALSNMEKAFTPHALSQGHVLQTSGQVLAVRLSEGLIKARVKDQSNHIYDVFLDLKTWPKSSSRCGCNLRHFCEHAAACLFALKAQNGQAYSIPHQAHSQTYQDKSDLYHEDILMLDDSAWYSYLEDKGHDFFVYQIGIEVEGTQINVVPLVVDLLNRYDGATLETLPDDKPIKLPLANRKVLQLPLGRIKPLIRVLLQLSHFKNSQDVVVNKAQLLLMLEAEMALKASKARWQATDMIRQQLQHLSNVDTLPDIAISHAFHATLRPYQQQGLNWLQFLRDHHFGGVLADDMGLGKTVQTLAHLQTEKDHGRMTKASLIIAPTSLVSNWVREAKKFTPLLKVLAFHGQARHQDKFDDYDIVVSTYGLVLRDKEKFLSYRFYYIILDEAQFIKNARTRTTQAIQQLQAQHRLCLSGTPLENHLGELWSLFHFLMPGVLGTLREFRQFFRLPIEKLRDQERNDLLKGRVKPFMLRRAKSDVLQELPLKTEMIREIELQGAQRDLYETIRISMEKRVRDAIASTGRGSSQIVLLDALLKLRQVCCDPRLLSLPEAHTAHSHSAKLEVLMELLDNLMEEGRRVLVFSQFTSMLKLIEKELNARSYRYLKLTGTTHRRQQVVDDFQNGTAPIFLISLKAGGTGLNLTRADTVIHYDPWWNPHVESQATDRVHRIGQNNPVFVYKLITKGTVEEIILDLQAQKKELFNDVLHTSTEALSWGMSIDEVNHFFAPLT